MPGNNHVWIGDPDLLIGACLSTVWKIDNHYNTVPPPFSQALTFCVEYKSTNVLVGRCLHNGDSRKDHEDMARTLQARKKKIVSTVLCEFILRTWCHLGRLLEWKECRRVSSYSKKRSYHYRFCENRRAWLQRCFWFSIWYRSWPMALDFEFSSCNVQK